MSPDETSIVDVEKIIHQHQENGISFKSLFKKCDYLEDESALSRILHVLIHENKCLRVGMLYVHAQFSGNTKPTAIQQRMTAKIEKSQITPIKRVVPETIAACSEEEAEEEAEEDKPKSSVTTRLPFGSCRRSFPKGKILLFLYLIRPVAMSAEAISSRLSVLGPTFDRTTVANSLAQCTFQEGDQFLRKVGSGKNLCYAWSGNLCYPFSTIRTSDIEDLLPGVRIKEDVKSNQSKLIGKDSGVETSQKDKESATELPVTPKYTVPTVELPNESTGKTKIYKAILDDYEQKVVIPLRIQLAEKERFLEELKNLSNEII